MKNREMEEKIKTAFQHAAPDVLESVLSDCGEQKGTVITLTEKKKIRHCGSLDDNDRQYLGIWGVPGPKYCGVDDFFGRKSQY